jgi:hypothetical protein
MSVGENKETFLKFKMPLGAVIWLLFVGNLLGFFLLFSGSGGTTTAFDRFFAKNERGGLGDDFDCRYFVGFYLRRVFQS